MKFFKRSKKEEDNTRFSAVKSDRIDQILTDAIEQYGKEYCLDIGCGNDKDDRFITVDINPECEPNFVGDIRAMFAPSPQYGMLRSSSDLNNIPAENFMVVRLKHIAEHIEWIYQQTFFEWVYSLMADGGLVELDTPNLEYIAKLYIANLGKQNERKTLKYPCHEHPDLDISLQEDMQRWVNFKLYSGGSPGDYHYACFDHFLLTTLLLKVGFDRVLLSNTPTLRCIAYKRSVKESSLDDVIDSMLM